MLEIYFTPGMVVILFSLAPDVETPGFEVHCHRAHGVTREYLKSPHN